MTELKNRENWQATHDLLVSMRDAGRIDALRMISFFTIMDGDGVEFMEPASVQCMLEVINDELDLRQEPVMVQDLLSINVLEDEDENVCGTAACLCGWAHLQAVANGEATPEEYPFEAGIRWFGLDPDKSGDPVKGNFIANGKWAEYTPLSQITMDQGIEYLAKVLETGEIESYIDDAPSGANNDE